MLNHRIFTSNSNFAIALSLVALAGCGSSGSGKLTSNGIDLCLAVCERIVTSESCTLAFEAKDCVTHCHSDVGSFTVRPECQEQLDSFATCLVAHQTCGASGLAVNDNTACGIQQDALVDCIGSSISSGSNSVGSSGGSMGPSLSYVSTGGKSSTASYVYAGAATGGSRGTGGYSSVVGTGGTKVAGTGGTKVSYAGSGGG